MERKILIIIGAIAYNRGSEALLRSLSKFCKDKYNNAIITVAQAEDNFKQLNITEDIKKYTKILNYPNKSLRRYIVGALKKIGCPTNILAKLKYSKLKKIAQKQDIIIIVGADNIDAPIEIQRDTKIRNTYIRNNTQAKMILYDCSLDNKNTTNILKEDLQNFDIVTARDSISLENLKTIANKDTLYYYPDPAFAMQPEKIELPKVFNGNGVVGINASNIIIECINEDYKDKVLKAYKNMMNYILDNTKKNIVLIPHVMNNKDLGVLRLLYKDYINNDRVYLIENEKLNAKQLKYIISKCDLYIGARTHSTIAAYSTNVPTLVLGYSVKSKGIAKDLFGTYENYVLPIAQLDSMQYLVNGFKWLYENQSMIKKALIEKMPEYIEKSKQVIEIL